MTDDPGDVDPSWRALAAVLALALAFTAVVMIAAMIELLDQPVGQAACGTRIGCEYYDGSSAERAFNLVLGFATGVLALAAAAVAVGFGINGRRGRLMLWLTGATVLFGASTIVYGAIR